MSIGANASEKPYCQKLKSQNSKFLPGQVAHAIQPDACTLDRLTVLVVLVVHEGE